MSDPVADIIGRVKAIGGRLTVVGSGLEYEGPTQPLTSDLRAEIKECKAALVERLRPRPIPGLLGHLADRGVWIALDESEHPRFHAREDADLDGVDESVIDELDARVDELMAFLRRPASKLTEAKAATFGSGPNARAADALSNEGWYVVPAAGSNDPEEATA